MKIYDFMGDFFGNLSFLATWLLLGAPQKLHEK
jgi:hypothetical protein